MRGCYGWGLVRAVLSGACREIDAGHSALVSIIVRLPHIPHTTYREGHGDDAEGASTLAEVLLVAASSEDGATALIVATATLAAFGNVDQLISVTSQQRFDDAESVGTHVTWVGPSET